MPPDARLRRPPARTGGRTIPSGSRTRRSRASLVALIGLAAVSAGPARAGDVALDRLVFRGGRNMIEIPHVEAHGTSLTSAELRDILDPSSALAAGQRLASLSASSILAPEVTVRPDPDAGGGPGQAVTAHDVVLSDVRAGRAGTLSVGAVDGLFRSAPEERDALTVGRVVAHDVDFVLALTTATGKRTDASLPLSPVYRDLSVAGAKLVGGDALTLSVDRLEAGAFEGRPLLVPSQDLAARLDGDASAGPDGGLFRAALLDALVSFKLDRVQVTGLSVADGAGHHLSLRVGTLLLEGWQALKIALMRVDDVSWTSPGADATVKRVTLSNLDRSALFGAVAAKLFGLSMPDATEAASAVPADLQVDAFHLALRQGDGDGTFPPGTLHVVDVPNLEVGGGRADDGRSAESHAHVEVFYDLPPGGSLPIVEDLRGAGLGHIDVTFGYRLGFDGRAREVRLDDFALDGRGLGSVALSARLADMSENPLGFAGASEAVGRALSQATFRELTLTLVDRGLVGVALPSLARGAGTSPAAFKADIEVRLADGLSTLLGHTPAEAAVLDVLKRLLDGPGTAVLSARSPNGVTVEAMRNAPDPAAIGRILDVTAAYHR